MAIYGYCRVSTAGQAKNGNSLDEQVEKLANVGATEIYKESYTGTKLERPELMKLLSKLKEGDTVVVTKLDRLARSASQGTELIDGLLAMGVNVHVLNMGLMDNTNVGRLIRNIMFAFAEFERDMIVERTQEGKYIAKQKEGFSEGRPKKFTDFIVNSALDQLTTNGGKYSYSEISVKTGISESTLKRAQRLRKVVL